MYLQYYMSIFLIIEDEDYLKHLKMVRMVMLISAIVWNTLYIVAFFWLLDFVDDWDSRDVGVDEMFVAMVLAYNLILHIAIFPINCVIILKEFSMEYYQVLRLNAGKKDDDVSLGYGVFNDILHDIWYGIDFEKWNDPKENWVYE